jgi:hypothetical protein
MKLIYRAKEAGQMLAEIAECGEGNKTYFIMTMHLMIKKMHEHFIKEKRK